MKSWALVIAIVRARERPGGGAGSDAGVTADTEGAARAETAGTAIGGEEIASGGDGGTTAKVF